MKPIAKMGDYPFAVDGISVFAATDKDAQPISDELFIVNERSTRVFDLVNKDADEIYTFKSMVYRDKEHKIIPLTATAAELQNLLGKNQFVVKIYDIDSGDVLGYAYKFFTNKIILSTGEEIPVVDFNKQTTAPAPAVIPVSSVTLNKSTSSGLVGGTEQLIATVLPAEATDKSVTWSTSGAAATVSSTGLVTLVSRGSANITVTTTDGSHTASCMFTITQPVASVTMTPATVDLSLSGTTTHSMSIEVLPADANNKAVEYTSSNDTIATVSSVGLVTAVGVGTATITVTTIDGAKNASSIVNVTA